MVKTKERHYAIWRTLKLGTYKSAEDLSLALTEARFRIGGYAAQILKEVVAATAETEIELVKVPVRDLGFEDGATREQIYARAAEIGLDLVPAEAGPQLRLQYPDQPYGECLQMAMKPITRSARDLCVFGVRNDRGDQWLHTYHSGPYEFWRAHLRWVFARRKRK